MKMSIEGDALIALMAAVLLGPKQPEESEASWEQRRDDAVARARRIWIWVKS